MLYGLNGRLLCDQAQLQHAMLDLPRNDCYFLGANGIILLNMQYDLVATQVRYGFRYFQQLKF